MYTVTIPQWIEGKPLYIYGIDVESPEKAIDVAIEKLAPIFRRYGRDIPDGMREVMSAKKEVSHGM